MSEISCQAHRRMSRDDLKLIIMTKADAYYTREKTAKASQICLMQYFGNRLKDFTIVGPTAGKGAMTNGMDRNVFDIHLFDLHPHEYVKQCSYLDLEVNALGERIIIFENPPFGQFHAVRFFNTMAEFAHVEYIAIVFPYRFVGDQKSSDGKMCLDENFHLVSNVLLARDSFKSELTWGSQATIQCSFQIWKRMSTKRILPQVIVRVGKHNIRRNHRMWYLKYTLNPHRRRTKKNRRKNILTRSRPNSGARMPIGIDPSKDTPAIRAVILAAFSNSYLYSHTTYNYHPGILQVELNKLLK